MITAVVQGAAMVGGVHIHSQNLSKQTYWNGFYTGLTHCNKRHTYSCVIQSEGQNNN